MNSQKLMLWALSLMSAVLLSMPWLIPHAGAVALVGFVPLLCADAVADQLRVKRFFLYHYLTFVLWNAATTFWVCGATVGGGVFAVLANAFQMSLVWGLFRLSKKYLPGILPYIFLASMWMAWEWLYFRVDISWPWLTLGNAFARSTRSIQWYEYTGTLGGSLWIWIVNLVLFGQIVLYSDRRKLSAAVRSAMALFTVVLIFGPLSLSNHIYNNYEQKSEGRVDVVIGQPDIDPYQKFQKLSQAEQTSLLVNLFDSVMSKRAQTPSPVLLIGPETFTGDVIIGRESATMTSFRNLLSKYPSAKILFGASTYEITEGRSAPSVLARAYGDGWIRSHNSAVMMGLQGEPEIYHKSKLVVGVESTPYPRVFVPVDNWLSGLLGTGGLIGRCEGQDEASVLHFNEVPVGCAVCYESIYGDWCRGYVNKGAQMLAVITNDAWWGNTPGYRQHLSYSCLRAIELRRDIARCGNTGISCFIDQRGDIVSRTSWWTRESLDGMVDLNSEKTFFAKYGDIAGMASAGLFILMLLLLVLRMAFFRPASR